MGTSSYGAAAATVWTIVFGMDFNESSFAPQLLCQLDAGSGMDGAGIPGNAKSGPSGIQHPAGI